VFENAATLGEYVRSSVTDNDAAEAADEANKGAAYAVRGLLLASP